MESLVTWCDNVPMKPSIGKTKEQVADYTCMGVEALRLDLVLLIVLQKRTKDGLKIGGVTQRPRSMPQDQKIKVLKVGWVKHQKDRTHASLLDIPKVVTYVLNLQTGTRCCIINLLDKRNYTGHFVMHKI